MALDLLAYGIYVRISREDNTGFLQREVMDTEHKLPQLETYNNFEQKIKYSLDLDINDHTRSKRETGAPIVIHKMQQANGKER